MNKTISLFAYLWLITGLLLPFNSLAQVDQHTPSSTTPQKADLGKVSSQFQDLFFEALAQSAIYNHEKAIDLLKECLALDQHQAVVYFQLGKNQIALKDYLKAENSLKKALKLGLHNRATLTQLYRLNRASKNYKKAIVFAKKLTAYDPHYFSDLAQLHLLDKAYLAALKALDQQKISIQTTKSRDLRLKIYREATPKKQVVSYLKTRLKQEGKNPQLYADLSYVYLKDHQLNNAYLTAKKLEKIDAHNAIISLVSYYYFKEKEAIPQAIAALKKAVTYPSISNQTKKELLDDFSTLVKANPQYQDELVWLLGKESRPGAQSNQQLGEYYLGKDNKKALTYFQKALTETPNDYQLIKETLILQLETAQYAAAIQLSERAKNLFPTQAFLYLKMGQAENGLKNYTNAVKALQTGKSFVYDQPKLKLAFYKALVKAHQGLGQSKKVSNLQQKIAHIKTTITP